MNKKEELKFAGFFTDWLNQKYSFDYRVFSNNDESKIDTEIDIYAKSKLGQFLQLNFQIVTSEGMLKKDLGFLRGISKKTGENVVKGEVKDLDSESWIKTTIKNKENKYSKEVKKYLILLIQKEVGSLFNENYFNNLFSEFKNSEFKGIYLVHFPSFKEYSSHPHKGQILAIKNINAFIR